MKVTKIEVAREIIDPCCDNVNFLVENESGYTYTITVSTLKDLNDQIRQEKTDALMRDNPKTIVRELTEKIVTEAVKVYA